jgi:L-ascorbate metabolism protein UlaG (beta-lactamase superfamily)
MSKKTITYAGHSAVFIEMGGLRVAIDPWLNGNPLCPSSLQTPPATDLIVLSHGHSDHASDAVRVAKETKAQLAATYELAMIMIDEGVSPDRVIPMNKGGSVTVGGVTVRLTNAFHSSSFDSPKRGTIYAGEPCGVLLASNGWTVFHAGDTALFSDLSLIGDMYQPDVALLPIGDRFTMGPEEAARAARMVKCTTAIPIHYKTFPLLTGEFGPFASACGKNGVEAIEIAPGEQKNF